MSEQKTEQQWNSEAARAERKERLNQMKDKNGGKKPIKMGSPIARIVITVILVVALLAGGGWFALNSGLPQQQLSAMAVNGDAVKVVELNYYYYMVASNYGVDFTDMPTAKETLAGASYTEGFATLHDSILDTAAKAVQENRMLAAEGQKAGLTIGAEEQEMIDNFFASIQDAADSEGVSITNYMAQYFGKGASKASLTPVFERLLLAQKFGEQKMGELTVPDAEIKAYYDEHRDEYDIISYRSFAFAAETAEDATEEVKTAALEAAKTKARAMAALITDEDSFKAQAIANASDDLKDSYTTGDASLSANTRYSSVAALAQAEWLFDDARKAGDINVVDDTTGSTVLYFIKRSIDDSTRVSIRHILFMADEATATAEEIAAAKTKAEDVLAQYMAGDRTEDAFAELAKANSEDNAADGGLYEDVYPGQMVDTFDSWIFDDTRMPGDTGIVQTNYGFHVMYFVAESGQEWSLNIRDVLVDESYKTYLETTKQAYPYEMNSIGLRFVP